MLAEHMEVSTFAVFRKRSMVRWPNPFGLAFIPSYTLTSRSPPQAVAQLVGVPAHKAAAEPQTKDLASRPMHPPVSRPLACPSRPRIETASGGAPRTC